MFYLLCAYLRIALFLGFHRYVYHLAHTWATMGAPRNPREEVAWYIQEFLLQEGYHQCPSCYWVTEKPNEHVNEVGSYCWQDQQPQCPTCHERLNGATECPYCAETAAQRAALELEDAEINAYLQELQQRYVKEQEEADAAYQKWEEEEAKFQQEQEALERFFKEEEEKNSCPTCGEHFSGCTCVSDAVAEYKARQWPAP